MRFLPTIALVMLALAAVAADSPSPVGPVGTASELAGTWAGTVEHDGETQPVALSFSADTAGRITIALSMPVVHLDRAPIARARPVFRGDSVQIGQFAFAYDARAKTLNGVVPAGLIPVYSLPLALHKVERFDMPERPAITAPEAVPVWTYEANTPLWAGPTFAGGVVYVGGQDGSIHAIDARTGTRLWAAATGGPMRIGTRRWGAPAPIRVRPVLADGVLYAQVDDGWLYALAVKDGKRRWRVRIVDQPIERLPFDQPASRFDRFGSDVVMNAGRLYVGTHDGKLLALDPVDGHTLWEFKAGDAILAAPAIAGGKVVFGSYDHFVYALDAVTGRQLWKRDTQGAVVSTPAIADDKVVVGNRCYDLLGLDLGTGDVAWKRYIWMSWVESSAALFGGTAYVGSSDAAAVYAFDAASGRRVWATDVFGWSWGQPAVTAERVYAGTSSQVGYLAHHQGAVFALDRATGKAVWRFSASAPDSGAYGFPGSPALGADHVFVSGLDGRVHAFRP